MPCNARRIWRMFRAYAIRPYFVTSFIRLIISMALTTASKPLSPDLVPASSPNFF
jgi:hypothetical protein